MMKLGISAAVGILALAACQPEPEPGSVELYGDSITLQALLGGSGMDQQPEDLGTYVGLGWQVHNAYDNQPPNEHLHDQVWYEESPRPDTLVAAFGMNDASPTNGGWTDADRERHQTFIDTPHPDSCVVVVLPGYGDGISAEHAANLDAARADLAEIAANREGPTVVLDWQPIIEDDPGLMSDDGIHLAPNEDDPWGISAEAAQARMSMYWEGVERC